MNHALRVNVQDALHDFERQVLNVVGVHLLSVVSDDVHQILGAILRHKIEMVEVLGVTRPHDGLQLDDVLVPSEYPEQSDLSQDAVGVDITFKNVFHFFDSDNLLVFLGIGVFDTFWRLLDVVSLVDDRGGPVANYLLDFVVGFDLNGVVDFLLETCLSDLLHGLGALLELAELDLLQATSHVEAVLGLEGVELQNVAELLGEHLKVFVLFLNYIF